ncbi:MAG: hypothetical protein A2X61_09490 [Ignavibacteria bacterium GWB2_35_12]|nr:MAG: hypothetical protein A2X61_09490 [Ignavibacteria bacterium GWB2_35_12]
MLSMAKVPLSGEEKSIEYIWSWFEDQKEALRDFRNKLWGLITTSNIKDDHNFFSFTTDDINDYFNNSEEELEHLVCFDLISATEAFLWVDFYQKVHRKDKSKLGKEFRIITKKKSKKVKGNISLEQDIIESWKKIHYEKKDIFSNLLGILNYRHWLAHGRYWKPKIGRQYTPEITYDIAENIFNLIDDRN